MYYSSMKTIISCSHSWGTHKLYMGNVCCNSNRTRVMSRWYNEILQGCSNVGGAAVSNSLTSAQCALCVCAFMAVLSIMDTEGV